MACDCPVQGKMKCSQASVSLLNTFALCKERELLAEPRVILEEALGLFGNNVGTPDADLFLSVPRSLRKPPTVGLSSAGLSGTADHVWKNS